MTDSSSSNCLHTYQFLQLLGEVPISGDASQDEANEFYVTPQPNLSYSLRNQLVRNVTFTVKYSEENDTVEEADQSSCSVGNCPTDLFEYYVKAIIIPILCTLGILGNIMNIFVLTRKRFQTSLDRSNKSCAMLGLISLAISDMLYCVFTIPEAFMGANERIIFRKKDFLYSYQIYRTEILNFFSNLSIWLTVLMAVSRYCAICKLQQSKNWTQTKHFVIALAILITVWILLILPATLWRYEVKHIQCPMYNFSVYAIDHGPYVRNETFQRTFTYIDTIVGFVIPLTVLSYCNYHLIRALQESVRTRHVYRVHERNTRNCSKITPTLIAVIFMFLIFCSPAKILSFCFYSIDVTMAAKFNILMVIANLLETVNYSVNFLLYCLVNSRFRTTLKHMFVWGRRDLNTRQSSFSTRYSSKRLSQPTYPLSNLNLSTVIQQQK